MDIQRIVSNRRLWAGAGACVAATMSLSALSAPALAETGDQRPCMTHGENTQVMRGMTMVRTWEIIDSRGRLVQSGAGQRDRIYDVCWTASYDIAVIYSYRNGAWRVLGKAIA